MYLDRILEFKRAEVKKRAQSSSRKNEIASARAPRDFVAAMQTKPISLIAEIKPKSPSRGSFAQAADPLGLALQYQHSGAAALSVLADREFFGGGPEVVARVANESGISLPVLYKEFVVDAEQIYDARACGADAVLLIARAVSNQLLGEFVTLTRELGMEALIETFDEDDVAAALAAGARMIGINNRDLKTFEVDLQRSVRLSSLIPRDIVKVSESGISSRSDVLQLEQIGFDGILVGEALLTSSDPGTRVAELLGSTRRV